MASFTFLKGKTEGKFLFSYFYFQKMLQSPRIPVKFHILPAPTSTSSTPLPSTIVSIVTQSVATKVPERRPKGTPTSYEK